MNKNDDNFDDNFDVMAELSHSQYERLINSEADIIIPEGVIMSNAKGQRILFFKCANKKLYEMLTDALDADRINWQ